MAINKEPKKIFLNKIMTPVGVAIYPHLVKPDTKFAAEGEYRTKLRFTAEDADKLKDQLAKLQDEAIEKFKEFYPKKSKILVKAALPIQPEVDDEGEETGFYLASFKRKASGVKKDGTPWKSRVAIADVKGQLVKKADLSLWGGSEIRISASVSGWIRATDNAIGLTLAPDAVQIKKLVSGGSSDNVSFGSIADGDDDWSFESTEDEVSEFTSNDTSDDEGDGEF